MNLLAIDSNAPWQRQLLISLTRVVDGLKVRGIRTETVSSLRNGIHKEVVSSGNYTESRLVIPGWKLSPKISSWLITKQIKKTSLETGKLDAIMYSLPHYASIAKSIKDTPQIYYSYDPYQHYRRWDSEWILEKQQEMLLACDCSFAVSEELSNDFRIYSEKPVIYLPNAIQESWITDVERISAEPIAPGTAKTKPRVGCIGRITSDTYDWDLLDSLTSKNPDAEFYFVGDKSYSTPELDFRMEQTLARPNITWTGFTPHSELPAHLSSFDVCLNPLAVSDHANRRSQLRLYDYLATSAPILSTPLSEAKSLAPHVTIADKQTAATILSQMLEHPSEFVSPEERKLFIRKNTWEARASQLWATMQKFFR
ncbi:glycosyltransferase [Rhodopirellula sp. SWK7]|uniref:glycosyltransferase n=1 Tax=Rhodopirellula sp. SWK7 TaxID=595460 RepID=UPI0002BDF43E|nr:glycosyltransferase [Rhodopirellula sp. SWK7]EMI41663.1 glycosyl transferase, group 1 [Rhodopirellula sp. SWK7]